MDEARHLAYAPRALESAKDSSYQRPEQILDALRRLDRLAEDYLDPDGIGCGLEERARQFGLPWQGGLHESLVARYPNHYTFCLSGSPLGARATRGARRRRRRRALAWIYLVAHPGDQDTKRALIAGHLASPGRDPPKADR
jgi:hypothetical protein